MKKPIGKMKFTFFYSDATLDTSIYDLDLSPRARHGLQRSHYNTIGEVIEHWNDLDKIRAFGSKCIKEVKSAIFNYNVENMSPEQLERFVDTFSYSE